LKIALRAHAVTWGNGLVGGLSTPSPTRPVFIGHFPHALNAVSSGTDAVVCTESFAAVGSVAVGFAARVQCVDSVALTT
jgi:hypothetical protein